MTKTALYRFFDKDGVLLYVGITERFGQRWAHHARNKPWWDEVHSQTAVWFGNKREATLAERDAIKSEGPKHNIVHVPKQLPPDPAEEIAEEKVLVDTGTSLEADYWTLHDVADHWGVSYNTVRTYRSRNRGELPPPDATFGRSPVWKPQTILTFQRPGQGARTDLKDQRKETKS